MQKRLRTEVIQLEDQLTQVRKEYDMLRLDFEQSIAANEQNGPINKEMRNLIASLQNHNSQLKNEIQRHKRRLKESNGEIERLKQEIEALNSSISSIRKESENAKSEQAGEQAGTSANSQPETAVSDEAVIVKEEKKDDGTVLTNGQLNSSPPATPVKREDSAAEQQAAAASQLTEPNLMFAIAKKSPPPSTPTLLPAVRQAEPDANLSQKYEKLLSRKIEQDNAIRELKNQIKKLTDQYKELKILHEMHKSAPKDLRERAQLMANEKKYKLECEELRKQLTKMQAEQKKDRKRSYDEMDQRESISLTGGGGLLVSKDAAKLKDEVEKLQKKVSGQTQEIEVLCKEMELTGNAFEEMQEANLRLNQQLKEKDEANFKLMSERIKSQQIQKLLKEEKESLTEQILSLQSHIEAQNQVVRKLEEKERLLQNHLSTTEKELAIRQKALEQHKRSAIEAAQSAADLKLHLDKYLTQLKEAQSLVAEKSSVHQQEAFKTKRLNEELICWRRKYERAKKFELASTADEVLLEEIREYKEQLTCPSCKVNRKDAVLTKCFHVFCFDCLKTRYDSRQRKCPKCNGPIGANDFHRLYLA